MKPGTYIVIAVVVLALLGGYWFFSQYIGLVAMNEVVNQGWTDLDAQLQSREDLIPDLVSAVKDRVPGEEDVFIGITDARGKLAGAATPSAKAEADEALTAALGQLLDVANTCPELNTDENFVRLRKELADAEKCIEDAIKSYNEYVEIYNICTNGFLVSFVSGRIGFLPREQFEPPKVSPEAQGEGAPDGPETE